MYLTFSTFLTCIRLLLIPLIVFALAHHEFMGAVIIFALALLSDLLDGYLARKWNQETLFGASLDPLADKVLIIACYTTLIFYPAAELALPTWFLLLVLCKELIILAGATYFGLIKKQLHIRALMLGKVSMVAQSFLVIWCLACFVFHWMPLQTFNLFLALTLILLIGSLLQYALQLYNNK